jgi:acetyl esterase/lipase
MAKRGSSRITASTNHEPSCPFIILILIPGLDPNRRFSRLTRLFEILRLVCAFAVAVFASGCVAAPLRGMHETVYPNLAFSHPHGRNLGLDLYVPPAPKPPPVVVWFHGGAWKYGDKRLRVMVHPLTRSGFAVASVQYRLSWSAKWPAQRDDALAAIDWLRAHGREYGIDPSRIGLAGESAGGHLAALAGVLEGAPRVRAVVAMYPPTDLTKLSARYREAQNLNLVVQLFGAPYEKTARQADEASPVNFVTPHAPPFLFIHGEWDELVPLEQSREMDRKLCAAGVESQLIVVPHALHGFSLNAPLQRKVADFFRKHL